MQHACFSLYLLAISTMGLGCGEQQRNIVSRAPAYVSVDGSQKTRILSCTVSKSQLRFHGRITNSGSRSFYIVRKSLEAPALKSVVVGGESTEISEGDGEGLPLPEPTMFVEDQIILMAGESHDFYFELAYECSSSNAVRLDPDCNNVAVDGRAFSITFQLEDNWDYKVMSRSGVKVAPHDSAYRGCSSTNSIEISLPSNFGHN